MQGLGLCLVVLSAAGHGTGNYPTVLYPGGEVVGKNVTTRDGREVEAFLGIPYAEPPLGNLRFQPPQILDLGHGVLLAQTQPSACAQPNYPSSSEDCLYLNIYTPNANDSHLLPVYLYIHGGAFEAGSAETYTHEYLMDQDIILVIIQYRLGLAGFLSTGDEVVPGNMGLKDQRCALRWVRRNIHRFGGDPHRVTIAGESSGAACVHLLMTYVAHEGLFRAAISQSGSGLTTWAFYPPEQVSDTVKVLANLSSCPRDSSGFVRCLKNKSTDDIVNLYSVQLKSALYPDNIYGPFSFLPLIGPVMEPVCVEDLIIADNPWRFNTNIPWLVGVNSKEALFAFLVELNNGSQTAFDLFDSVFNRDFPLSLNYQYSAADGSQVPLRFRSFYLHNKTFSRSNLAGSTDGISDALFDYSSFEAALRAKKGKTFFYLFDYIGANILLPVPRQDRIGAAHTDDVFFFFPGPPGFVRNNSEADTRLSLKLIKLWINFATYLDPTPGTSGDTKWVPFHPKQYYLHIKQNGMQIEYPFYPRRMAFWDNLPFPHRNDIYPKVTCSPIVKIKDSGFETENQEE